MSTAPSAGPDADLVQMVDSFARRELHPLAERMDLEEWWPDDVFPRLGELGLLGVTASPEHGGVGADLVTAGAIGNVLARWNHALALAWVAHDNLCLHNLDRNGSEAQRARYVPGLASGQQIGALALTEPGAGSDALGSMRTTARRDGDHYVLNGTKLYITNGPVADLVLVYAKTAPERGTHGISAFLVERGTPGFRVGQKLTKMGFRGSQTAELVFEDCRVPAANLLGRENEGVAVVMSGLDVERAMIAPLCVGIAERALQLSIEYAKVREQFGRPIGSFQMIQAKLADMYTWVETMRCHTFDVLRATDAASHESTGRGEIHARTAASVLYAAETLNRVLDHAMQIHGGAGYIWESEVNRLYRSIKLLEIGAGTSEVRRLIIAGELLS